LYDTNIQLLFVLQGIVPILLYGEVKAGKIKTGILNLNMPIMKKISRKFKMRKWYYKKDLTNY
jgi:hypothetical protein